MASKFVEEWNQLAKAVHETMVQKGFWEPGIEKNDGEQIALMHSELSECLEGIRHGNPASEHIPDFRAAEEELADVVIRIMDTAHARGWDVAEAVEAKMTFNRNRPHKHGGKKF